MTEYTRDLEESDELLEENAGDPVDFWERKQRELLTSVVDYNLQGLTDLVTDRAIDLSPSYQRRLRWDERRQSRLIESFLMNVPVPPVFLNEDQYGSYSVIDGKQRITTIHDFMRGKLKLRGLEVFHELNGQTIDDLPVLLQRAVRTRPTLRAIIILRQSDEDVKFNVFQRLNTGGVRLNAQEIRNSAWPGPLNELINRLSENAMFHRLLGISSKQRSAIYQEMRDAEFVLRFLAFHDSWEHFSGGMKRHMDRFMAENQRMSPELLEQARASFLLAVEAVNAAFGDHAFHRWTPDKETWRRQVLASLFDAQMFAVQGIPVDALAAHRQEIVEGLKHLFGDAEFRKSVDAATNTPALFRYRIGAVRQMVEALLDT